MRKASNRRETKKDNFAHYSMQKFMEILAISSLNLMRRAQSKLDLATGERVAVKDKDGNIIYVWAVQSDDERWFRCQQSITKIEESEVEWLVEDDDLESACLIEKRSGEFGYQTVMTYTRKK